MGYIESDYLYPFYIYWHKIYALEIRDYRNWQDGEKVISITLWVMPRFYWEEKNFVIDSPNQDGSWYIPF